MSDELLAWLIALVSLLPGVAGAGYVWGWYYGFKTGKAVNRGGDDEDSVV